MTDKQLASILDDMLIICDSREKKNQHVLEYFEKNNIKYKIDTLKTADYTFCLPNYPELNLDKKFLVERKGSLNEIAGNFTTNRERFIREFERLSDEKIQLVLENGTWKKILNGSYRCNFNSNSFMASLLTITIRYGCPVHMCTTEESPILIYNILKYELREYLKINVDKLEMV